MIHHQESFMFDADVPLDKDIILYNHPLWKEGIYEWANSKAFGIDIETYGEDKDGGLDYKNGNIRLIQIGLLSGKTLIADLGGFADKNDHNYDKFFNILKYQLSNDNCLKIGMNLKFEQGFFLNEYQIKMRGIRDVMLMSQILWAIGGTAQRYKHSLEAIAERCGLEVDKSEQKTEWGWTLTNKQLNYAAQDAQIVLPIASKLKELLIADNLWDQALIECNACPAFAQMEYVGMPVNLDKLQELRLQYINATEQSIKPLLEEFPEVKNPRSHEQTYEALNSKYNLGLLIAPKKTKEEKLAEKIENKKNPQKKQDKKKKKKNDNVNKKILVKNKHIESVNALLTFRSLNTQIDYAQKLIEYYYGGSVRGNYAQMTAVDETDDDKGGKGTGRSSCSKPNLQNPAKEISTFKALGLPAMRTVFEVPEGYKLIVSDLSQAHARIAAEYSQDEALLDIYKNYKDIHSITACIMAIKKGLSLTWSPENIDLWRSDSSHQNYAQATDLRNRAKNVNYGSINQQSPATYQNTLATAREPIYITDEEAKQDLGAWKGVYKKFITFCKNKWNDANNQSIKFEGLKGVYGFIRGLSGRKVYFEKFLQTDKRTLESKMAVKFTDSISALWITTEADVIKTAMALILKESDEHPEWVLRICNMAHDEIDCMCKEEYAETVAVVQNKIMDDCMRKYIKTIPVNEKNFNPLKSICNSWSEK